MSEEIDYKSAYESVLILKDMLIKENQQLKEDLHQASISIQEMVEMDIMCPTNCDKLTKYKSVLDEIRECVSEPWMVAGYIIQQQINEKRLDLLQMLDKVKE